MPIRIHNTWILLCLGLVSCSRGTPSVEVLIERAHLQERQGKLPEAIETYNQILKVVPTRASVHYDRGVAYDNLQNFEAAYKDYSRAVELDKTFYRAYNNRAVLQSRRGEYAAAVADCNETLLLNPQDSLAIRNRGFARLNLNQFETALEDFNQSIQIDGQSAMSYVLRGQAYQALNRHDRALEDFNQAIQLDSSIPDGFYYRAISQARRGDYDAAQKDLNVALQIDKEIDVSPELRKLLTDRPQSTSTATKEEVPSGDSKTPALQFAVTALKGRGFSVSNPLTSDSWTLQLTDPQGQPALGHVVITHGKSNAGISIAADIVEELKAKKTPVLLIILRAPEKTQPESSASSNYELIAIDDQWLSDPDRLRPATFHYRIPEKQLSSSDPAPAPEK